MDDIVTELAQRCAGQGRTRELMTEAANEIERLRSMVEWFVQDRMYDFEEHPQFGPCLVYDGMGYLGGENLPADIIAAFRQAWQQKGGRPWMTS